VRNSQGAEVLAAPGVGVTQPIEIEADGELVGALPARFSLLPAALTLA
jgi:diacylglycerol kinase family enzyme